MKPTLRQLEYVVAVAAEGSFSRAAQACGVSQPGLSAQVQRLERGLGIEIFERRPREVVPTRAGERVVAAARQVLHEVDGLLAVAETVQDPLAGTVRLGVIPTIAPYLLPRVMPLIRDHFPEMRLLLQEERTDRLVALLTEGTLDLALVALESDLTGLETLPLFVDPFVLAVRRGHPLARRARVRPDDLAGEEVLLLEDGHCLRQQTSRICDAAGACELGDFRATSLGTLVHMVETGVGVTLLPEMAIQGDRSLARNLETVPFTAPRPGRTVALAWRPSSPHRDRFEAFGKLIARPPSPPPG